MSFKNAFLLNLQSETHLRDARHANQIYTSHNFAFSPKVKYMYHISFVPNEEVGKNSNTFAFQKEIGVLVKSADLPSFRASVENKQQYNRKKNVQTRVDYQDCRIVFHDDNTGVTRALLEEYYRYYFEDANKITREPDYPQEAKSAFGARDKYFARVPNYGMNTGKINPFFKSITIHQLARRNWYAYTLVNPLLSAWDHGGVDSNGSEFNENTISVAYEAVQYTNGTVGSPSDSIYNRKGSTPPGMADASIGYDVTPSPLGYLDNAMIPGNDGGKGLIPTLIGLGTSALLNKAFGNSNSPSKNIFKQVATGVIGGLVSNVLSQNKLPVPDTQNSQTPSESTSNNSVGFAADKVLSLLENPSIMNQVIAPLVNSGTLPNTTMADYNSATPAVKLAYQSDIKNLIAGGDQKLIQIASNALNNLGYGG
jgi:hypothetical protein